jgi:DNA-binding MarR family transcriptional regulator
LLQLKHSPEAFADLFSMPKTRQSAKVSGAIRDRNRSLDQVDGIISAWAREWPKLDTSPAAIVGRLGRLTRFFDAGLARTFKRFGLTRADFDVLATLRRSGWPYRLPQKTLMKALMRQSGTTSFRVDRLERLGFVRRSPDPRDKRGALVTLTAKGRRRLEAAAPVHLANENRMLGALSQQERDVLISLLRRLLLSLE